jgi:phosphoribosylformylglycinamidine synthase
VGIRLAAAGNALVLVGQRRDELGGSEAARLLGQRRNGNVPTVDFAEERRCAKAVLALAEAGHVRSAHDVSAGGLFVTAAEMMLGAWSRVDLGLELDLRAVPGRGDFERLFSETGGYLLELEPGVPRDALAGVPHWEVGSVIEAKELRVRGDAHLIWTSRELEQAWGESFRSVME